MIKYNIKDYGFAHAHCSSWWNKSKYIEWDRTLNSGNICFYTDDRLHEVSNDFYNIAWLLEPPQINSNSYNWIRQNYNKFDMILTYDESLLNLSDKFKFYVIGGCWIDQQDQKIHDKSKKLSIIASYKRQTFGHILRHQIVDKYKNKIDAYGLGYKKVDKKIEGLKDYMFSIAIENQKMNSLFTEKIIDCFLTGTIPIYYGCPKINEFFNIEGIIQFDNLDEIENIIDNLNEDEYQKD
jgi:hypothetical protein